MANAFMSQMFPKLEPGQFGGFLQEASPLLLAMSAGMREGRGPFAYAPHGFAAMDKRQKDREEAEAKRRAAEMLGGLFTGGGFDGGSAPPRSGGDYYMGDGKEMTFGKYAEDFDRGLARTESGGNYGAVNSEGFTGKYQFGQPRLDDYNRANKTNYTTSDLKASPELQERVQDWHVWDIDQFIRQRGLDKAIGQEIGGIPITQNGLRAMAHLGGKGGAARFVLTGGKYNPADSNGTRLSDYARIHAGDMLPDVQQQQPPVMSAQNSGMPQLTRDQVVQILQSDHIDGATKQFVLQEFRRQQEGPEDVNWQTVNAPDGSVYQVHPHTGEKRQLFGAPPPKPEKATPYSEAAKAKADLDAGFITQEQYDAIVAGGGKPGEDPAMDLRKEFQGQATVKDFNTIVDSYGRILTSGEDPSPAGDLALIFNYMRMLDPGSVVRESEFATAAKSGSYGERIAALVGNIEQGTRLTPSQRADFLKRAEALYDDAHRNFRGRRQEYVDIAKRTGLGDDAIPNAGYVRHAPGTSPLPTPAPQMPGMPPVNGGNINSPPAPNSPQPMAPPELQLPQAAPQQAPTEEQYLGLIQQAISEGKLTAGDLARIGRISGNPERVIEYLRRKGVLQ